ncbi:hypothetical protein MWH03_00355 [Klebsiella pneumoniae]|nr:hypothetical protein [Klebsiella pneumoniae]
MKLTPERKQLLEEELAYLKKLCEEKPFLRDILELRIQGIHATLDERLALGFDWIRLAQMIADNDPDIVYAGFREDLGPTNEVVYVKGEMLKFPHLTYSIWATPVVALGEDGGFIDCWKELTPEDENLAWPDEAMAILHKAGCLITLMA